MAGYSRIETLLSGLHYLDSDVRIEFGETTADHAHIHSGLLAAECPGLDTADALPNLNGIRVFAVAFRSGTCILEPLTSASILSTDAACHRFHDSSLAPAGWSTPRNDGEHRGQAARNQNLYAKRQYITILNILYEESISLDDLEPYPSRDPPLARLHSATTSVIETCARAEALGCLQRVACALLNLVFKSELLGQCVAQTPIKFLKLASKVDCKKLFFMAARHICADRKLSKNWFDASTYYNANHGMLELQLTLLLGQGSKAAQKLLQALLDVQLCRTHMMAAGAENAFSVPNMPLLNTIVKQSYCGECIARTCFAGWLSDKLEHCANSVSDMLQDETRTQFEIFQVVLHRLQRYAATSMPFQVFSTSSNIHITLADELGLCGELLVEKDIKLHLDVCVQEAATAINKAFRMSQTELTEENFPSLGSSTMAKSSGSDRKVSGESYITSSSAGRSASLPVFSTAPSRASTRVTSAESKVDMKLDPAAVSFTCEDISKCTESATPLRLPLATAKTGSVPQSAPRVDSLSPPLRKASPSLAEKFAEDPSLPELWHDLQNAWEYIEDSSEKCLPSDLLAEIEDPSDRRWKSDKLEYYRCCGEKKKDDGMPGSHRCRSMKVVVVKWASEMRVKGQDKSIW
ncbi:hypothetical protein Slin14017_G122550 [Septoria linicola]|nr:hypothetical protein Slin14017_G122550 [Septoria linicola]